MNDRRFVRNKKVLMKFAQDRCELCKNTTIQLVLHLSNSTSQTPGGSPARYIIFPCNRHNTKSALLSSCAGPDRVRPPRRPRQSPSACNIASLALVLVAIQLEESHPSPLFSDPFHLQKLAPWPVVGLFLVPWKCAAQVNPEYLVRLCPRLVACLFPLAH